MANRKVRESERKVPSSFSIKKKNADGLREYCEFHNTYGSDVVDQLIANFLKLKENE